jgi:hypothetical protein
MINSEAPGIRGTGRLVTAHDATGYDGIVSRLATYLRQANATQVLASMQNPPLATDAFQNARLKRLVPGWASPPSPNHTRHGQPT